MRVGFLTFEQFRGKKDIGSSRIRARWVAAAMTGIGLAEAEVFRYGQKYDAVVYQKAYFTQHAAAFGGVKIFDLCDPDWMDWSIPLVEMLALCDAVTVSTAALGEQVEKMTDRPVYVVPDRMRLEELPAPRPFKSERAKTVCWYGYSQNFPMLNTAVPEIARLGLELVVISDRPWSPPPGLKVEYRNVAWGVRYAHDIQSCDVVINPQSPKGRWRFKSDNKTGLSKALGVPVAGTPEELCSLVEDPAARLWARESGLKEAAERYDVADSARDMMAVIGRASHAKFGIQEPDGAGSN